MKIRVLQRVAWVAVAIITLAATPEQDTKMRSEIVTQDTVDVWVSRIGNNGSVLSLEARNRGANSVRLRGKIITVDSNTGAAIKQCEYELNIPVRTFVSKKTKCSLSGADLLQTTIDELLPIAP